jgi:hypothetical protein
MIDNAGRRGKSDNSGISYKIDTTDTTQQWRGCIGCIKYLFYISCIDYHPACSTYRLRGIYALSA